MPKIPNDFGRKYGNKKQNERAEWVNNITRELEGLEECFKTHRTTQNDTKKNTKLENARPRWNTWFLVQEIRLHSRQTSTRNEQTLTRSTGTRLDDQRKDHIDPKGPKQRNSSKQLQTNNLPANDVKNTNGTNKRKDLLFTNKPRIVPCEQKGFRKGSRGTAELHRSAYPK